MVTECPRLVTLYQRRTHQIQILQTSPRHQEFLQPFMLVDGEHLVTRFHADHPRGKLCLDDPAEAVPFQLRFDELREAATPVPRLAMLNI